MPADNGRFGHWVGPMRKPCLLDQAQPIRLGWIRPKKKEESQKTGWAWALSPGILFFLG